MSRSAWSDFRGLNLDLIWGGGERLAGALGRPLRDHMLPIGDGSLPVLTLPGFLASESSLSRLNETLNAHGYATTGWRQGTNLGPQKATLLEHIDQLEHSLGRDVKIMADAAEHPIALVGWSLGGVYARELAKRMPEYIDRVITLGSPTIEPETAHHLNKLLRLIGRRFSGHRLIDMTSDESVGLWDAHSPPLPMVSIYSTVDRVVPEGTARIPDEVIDDADPAAPRENIPILCSHTGMASNPFVILAVLDRLAQPSDDWVDFDAHEYFHGPLRLWPTPFRHPYHAATDA